MNLQHLFEYKDNQLVILADDSQISWQQLKQEIASIQHFLLSNKVKSCALFSHDSFEFIACLLACNFLGIDILLPPNNSAEMIKTINADVQIGNFSHAAEIECRNNAIVTNKTDCNISIFTSGSTGEPKKITRKLSQLLLEVAELNDIWNNLPKVDLVAASVSYQHIYGLLFSILLPLINKTPIWHKPLPFEESLENLVTQRNKQSIVLISSPAFLKRLSIQLDENNNASLTVFSSGGLLTQTQHKQAEEKLNATLYQVYGSSETGGIAHKDSQNLWQFFPSVEHKIMNDSLYVKSPFCYNPNWHDTHDRIKTSTNGFELCGRNDRIVKIEEKRVSLDEIEAALNSYKNIKESYAICINDTRQYIACIIVLKDENVQKQQNQSQKQLKMRIKSYLRTKIEPLAIPKKIRFLTEIPCNSQGKKVYNEIVKVFKQ